MNKFKFLIFMGLIIIFFGLAGEISADYYSTGTLTSTNLLSGLEVESIDSFWYNASSIPAGTSLQIQFSNDLGETWYNSVGLLNGWDNCTTTGGATIDLSGLGWSSANFSAYFFTYKAEFSSGDGTNTPVLDEIRVYYTSTPSVFPCSSHNVWGWAWSENIGWISFSCENTMIIGEGIDYGVDIDEITGEFSGYAWSENIGWISFNSADVVGCPSGSGTCTPTVNLDTGQVDGWARALNYGDGWNGWLRLKNTNYEIWIDSSETPSEFRDWSWSDMNIGWLSFNWDNQAIGLSDYKVMTSLTFDSNLPPEARNLLVTQGTEDDYCNSSYPPVFLSWEFYDPNPGDTQGAYQVQVDNNSDFSSPENDSGKVNNSSETYAPINLAYNTTYYWQVKVWDDHEPAAESEWAIGSNFTTDVAHPVVDFTWEPSQPVLGEEVQFIDESYACGEATLETWSWIFEYGDPVSSTEQNPLTNFTAIGAGGQNAVTLTITDDHIPPCSCSITRYVPIALPLPEWKEIVPF